MVELQRDVCSRCVAEQRTARMEGEPLWDASDERRWRDGLVLCPGDDWKTRSRFEGPPPFCLYKLEYMMLEPANG